MTARHNQTVLCVPSRLDIHESPPSRRAHPLRKRHAVGSCGRSVSVACVADLRFSSSGSRHTHHHHHRCPHYGDHHQVKLVSRLRSPLSDVHLIPPLDNPLLQCDCDSRYQSSTERKDSTAKPRETRSPTPSASRTRWSSDRTRQSYELVQLSLSLTGPRHHTHSRSRGPVKQQRGHWAHHTRPFQHRSGHGWPNAARRPGRRSWRHQ